MKSEPILYIKLILVSVFWGGTFIAGRVATRSMDPLTIAFSRFLVASVFLSFYLTARDYGWVVPDLRQTILLTAAGMTGIVAYNLLFFNGLKLIEANRASLIVALNPALIMVAAGLLGMEKFTRERLLGIPLALFGVSIVLTSGDYSNIAAGLGKGEVLILGCVLSWVTYTILGRVLVQGLSPLVVTTYSSIAGCLGLMIPAVLRLRGGIDADPWAVVAVLFLGIFGTSLAFVWYYEGVQQLGPTRAGVFINLVPAWGVLLSALILGERIVPASLLGGIIIVGGVLLTNRRRLSQSQHAP
ncbi:MAG: DMT family transporter [Anaerolineales bacterium]|nr:DMT family transporter [Anaerolineales bacterium]